MQKTSIKRQLIALAIIAYSIFGLTRFDLSDSFQLGAFFDGWTLGLLFGEFSFIIYLVLIIDSFLIFMEKDGLLSIEKGYIIGFIIFFVGIIMFSSINNFAFIKSKFDFTTNADGDVMYLNTIGDYFYKMFNGGIPVRISSGFIGITFSSFLAFFIKSNLITIISLLLMIAGGALLLRAPILGIIGWWKQNEQGQIIITNETITVNKEDIEETRSLVMHKKNPVIREFEEDDFDMPFLQAKNKQYTRYKKKDDEKSVFISDNIKIEETTKIQKPTQEEIAKAKQESIEQKETYKAPIKTIKAQHIKQPEYTNEDLKKVEAAQTSLEQPEEDEDELDDYINGLQKKMDVNKKIQEIENQSSRNDDYFPNEAEDEVKPFEKMESLAMVNDQKNIFYKLPVVKPIEEDDSTLRQTQKIEAEAKKDRLTQVFEQFKVAATVDDVEVGPTITRFQVSIKPGTRVSKVTSLQNDLKLALAAKEIRIEAPIPGKSAIGIEIPNKTRTMVTFNNIVQKFPDEYKNSKLVVALGKDITGQTIYCNLEKMPHLLVAGATGSGKSVCINTIICSLLLRAKPDELKLVLVDPKKVELAMFGQLPHLLAPVISDAPKANLALKEVVKEMEKRYTLFEHTSTRNIASYNKKNPDNKLPLILVIIDELADLMLVAAKEVENSIQRITQMARAAGIHLIIATQRPSTDVITGIIKANIPSRMSFAVSSAIDSRTVLDSTGAEKLVGRGDMLFSPIGLNSNARIQGAFISDEVVEDICLQASSQMKPVFNESISNPAIDMGEAEEFADDSIYADAREKIINGQIKPSTSKLQRYFSIGYNKASKMIDALEAEGVIGPPNGSKPREVLIKDEKNYN